jgi:hypothetical protein
MRGVRHARVPGDSRDLGFAVRDLSVCEA